MSPAKSSGHWCSPGRRGLGCAACYTIETYPLKKNIKEKKSTNMQHACIRAGTHSIFGCVHCIPSLAIILIPMIYLFLCELWCGYPIQMTGMQISVIFLREFGHEIHNQFHAKNSHVHIPLMRGKMP